jgi:hypothetical protein
MTEDSGRRSTLFKKIAQSYIDSASNNDDWHASLTIVLSAHINCNLDLVKLAEEIFSHLCSHLMQKFYSLSRMSPEEIVIFNSLIRTIWNSSLTSRKVICSTAGIHSILHAVEIAHEKHECIRLLLELLHWVLLQCADDLHMLCRVSNFGILSSLLWHPSRSVKV